MTERDDLEQEVDGAVTSGPAAPQNSPAASAPWFGYIGLGITLVAMAVGLAAVVIAVLYFLHGGWG